MQSQFEFAKDKLAKAFLEYLMESETTLDGLTIHHLSQRATINRVTFYRNFLSLEDFIKWFLLKDLIFKADSTQTVAIDVAFSRLFDYISHFRIALRKILASKLGNTIEQFIVDESKYYQRLNLTRLDQPQRLDEDERRLMVDFYGSGIGQLILLLIRDTAYETMTKENFIRITYALVNNYIESTIEKLKLK